ncbi:hypothetical protein ACFSJT_12775 [Aquimarina celericrescens]|uniref:Beta-lactamase-inhibitor-like PepSY-like domain-containing protein n=2 Tax=Aquimarina celericrescens TaxID=1964542 RepID=A0ABW5AXC8_9FLAO
MKKLPMIVVIVVSIFSAQGAIAQDELAMNDGNEFFDYEYELQEYTEINVVELPLSIQETAAKDYHRFKIVEAYMSKDNTYKIVLKDNNDNTKIVFASANGKWIKPNDNKS